MISAADNDWPEFFRNLANAQAVWQRLTIIIIREGATPRVSGFFFKSVVQADTNYHQGGGDVAGIRIFLLICAPVCTNFWGINLGGHPPHGPGTGGVPRPGGAMVDREASSETAWRKMVVRLGGGSKSRCGF